ncbi:hypothetical protein PASE110613_16370 [Paenibacillus sediminis]|uniref:Lipoprotein n=1 Tax=Paenibacillus sediminis TaxID=664909 RepID=A0ABS4H799_9BACL|nr:hypothetical protein [Paenibacillus sediminis]MBP1938414.1 hypothetical protein [Paenibacillus sediminis]
MQRRECWGCFILIMLLIFLAGCSQHETSWTSFEGSAIDKGFPVPKEANKTDHTSNNPKMDYVRYSLNGLKEMNGIPDAYLKEIQTWGWTEHESERMGNMRAFQKGTQMIHIAVYDNYFTLMIVKEDENPAVKGISKSK